MKSPILNSPYYEPARHFAANERGLTETINEFRRPSSVYIPVPRPRTSAQQARLLVAEGAYGTELQQENEFINKIRAKVGEWRGGGYSGITRTSRELLNYWRDESRENKLFFCQIEALETLMYLNEAADKAGENWINSALQKANKEANEKLYRIAFKMATGSGKTVVMAMIIAYNTLNKIRYPQDTRFTDTFAVITPGITIRDRLNVLKPQETRNYYVERNIVSYYDLDQLVRANVFITNFHQLDFRANHRISMGATLKATGFIDEQVQKESPSAMVNRAFKSIVNKSRVLVINDEAHHCYRRRESDEELAGEDLQEADQNNEEARVWIRGLEALSEKVTINGVIDLSATPYFLRGSGYPEGTLFPWTVYDFSLLDALECGVVKIPRLPVESDTIKFDETPEFRDLWVHVREELPKKGRKTGDYDLSEIALPTKLDEALKSLYGSYEQYYKLYKARLEMDASAMPPVMIVVCNNTTVSEMVYRWIAGFEKETPSGKVIIEKGNLDIFRNEDTVHFFPKPNTILVDSAELESGRSINADFKRVFANEIGEFRKEYKKRFSSGDEPTDEEFLREVMNTVGKPDRLGENIKCVVSVSMLTEGWDVNSVTHILGVRAFSTQLLCEQVVGRALRRTDYEVGGDGLMRPEYAEVYGVPFNFLRAEGPAAPQEPRVFHRVHALEEREQYEITFPRVIGYRYELDEEKLSARFTEESRTIISNEPTEVISTGVIGEETKETLQKIKEIRRGTVVEQLVKGLLEKYYTDAEGTVKIWLYPQLKRIVEEYLDTQVVLKDRMVIGYLSVGGYRTGALTKIQQAIVKENIERKDAQKVLPILAPYDSVGSTRYVNFTTTREVQATERSHVNYMVADTAMWEQGVAKRLEQMPEVKAYVKNENLGFSIPYEHEGNALDYHPDFIAMLETREKEKLNLLIEVTGKKDDKKALKVKTAREMWVPAVNNDGRFGKWAFLEIQDIHETQNLIQGGLVNGFDSMLSPKLISEK